MSRTGSIILVHCFVAFCFAVNSSGQNAKPETLVYDFVNAWNSHSEKAFDRLFTDDAIWVAVAEARTEGRKEIVKEFAEIHSSWAKNTTVKHTGIKVQRLRPDVAVLLFHGKFVENGKEVDEIDRAMIIVAVRRAGRWKIATGQLTKQHDGA